MIDIKAKAKIIGLEILVFIKSMWEKFKKLNWKYKAIIFIILFSNSETIRYWTYQALYFILRLL